MTFELFVALALKSTIVAILALAASWLLRRRPAREQVAALGAGMLALIALPWGAFLLPSLDIALVAEVAAPPPLPVADRPVADTLARAALSPEFPSLAALVLLAYGGGVLAFATRLVLGLVMLAGWTRRSAPVTDARWLAALGQGRVEGRRGPRLLVSADIAAPLSWGVWPGTILIDRETLRRPERADAVIAHELAHLRGLDWPALLLARVATSLFWFNPFVWLAERALLRRAEIAADEAASRRVERFTYAQMLLDVANATHRPALACGMASPPSLLAERLRCILHARRPRPAGRAVPLAILGSAVIVSAPLAAARFVAIDPMTAAAPMAMQDQVHEIPASLASTATAEPGLGPAQLRPARAAALRPVSPLDASATVAALSPAGASPIARQASPPVSRQASPPGYRPTMDQRNAAWELSEQARALRIRAAALETESNVPRTAPGRDPPEPVRAMRAEADRLDMAARRLIFGS